MALGDKSSSFNTYLSIFGGQIVQEWRKEPSEDRIPDGKELQTRENKNGKKVWYVAYDYVAGLIGDVKLDTSGDFGSRLIITLNDVDESYVVTLPLNSSYAQDFLMKMGNIDLSKEVSFEPWTMTPEEWFKLTKRTAKGDKSGLTIKQDDEKVDKVYTKENPGDLPELVQKKTKQGVKWYDDDRMDFLLERLEEFIAEVKGESAAPDAKPSKGKKKTTKAPEPEDVEEEVEDDLPW